MSRSNSIIVALPKSHESSTIWHQLVQKSRDARLAALKASPQAFGGSHEKEVLFTPDIWDERLRNSIKQAFVAVRKVDQDDTNPEADIANVINEDWQGNIVLTGPLGVHEVRDAPELGLHVVATVDESLARDEILADEKADVLTPHYMINNIYVFPSGRGAGLGGKLIEACIAHGKAAGKEAGAKRVRFTLIVDYENEPARKLYLKTGFQIIRRYWFDDYRAEMKPDGSNGQTEAAVMERVETVE